MTFVRHWSESGYRFEAMEPVGDASVAVAPGPAQRSFLDEVTSVMQIDTSVGLEDMFIASMDIMDSLDLGDIDDTHTISTEPHTTAVGVSSTPTMAGEISSGQTFGAEEVTGSMFSRSWRHPVYIRSPRPRKFSGSKFLLIFANTPEIVF